MRIVITIFLLFCCLGLNAQVIWTSRPKVEPKSPKLMTMDDYRKDLSDWIFYRGLTIENENQGLLTALFMLGDDRKVKYVKILKSPHDQISYLVISALKGITYPDAVKSNQPYVQPINFKIFYITRKSYDFAPEHSVDSIQAKLSPAVSLNSGLIYNPGEMAKPATEPVTLKEIIKLGYKREPMIQSVY